MSPVFVANPSPMSSISLNNTQIRTFINIFPPTPLMSGQSSTNFGLGPVDLRKHPSPSMALYQYYFPHLLPPSLSNNPPRELKRPHLMPAAGRLKTNLSVGYLFISLLEDALSLRKRKQHPSSSSSSAKRFDFAKLADEAVKDKTGEISNSSETSSNQMDLSVSSTPSPAAITSGVSLLASTSP